MCSFFGGVPQSTLYDNTKIAVVRILGDGKRQRTRGFAEFQSHYLVWDRFGRPGKGNDKGKVEGPVGYAGRNFLVPLRVFDSFEALNAYVVECCRRRMADRLRSHNETIASRLERDLAAFHRPLPQAYDDSFRPSSPDFMRAADQAASREDPGNGRRVHVGALPK